MLEANNYCDLNGSDRITQLISDLKSWHGQTLAQIRKIILDAEPDIREEWKWGTPVWSKGGSICNAVLYKRSIKLNFYQGSSLVDPNGLFNHVTDESAERSITIQKGETIDEQAFQELIREAITFNILGDLFNKEGGTQKKITEGEQDFLNA
jgi:hypothetical protein